MRFCFIVEAQYRYDSMPMIVLQQLLNWGHTVDILEPQRMIPNLADLLHHPYDAYVLKTVSDGPGLTLLEAAEAAGVPTINRSQAIRHVRDKTVAMAIAMTHDIPTPQTYFISDPRLINQIPEDQFPLVIKPNNGSSCRNVHYIDSPTALSSIDFSPQLHCFWLAQHYEENRGFDVKLYVAGEQVFAVAKRSPLHPDIEIQKHPIPVTAELRQLALSIGHIFGLDIFGLDVVETAHGPMVVDINDFPSFGNVFEAEKLLATCILEATQRQQQLRLSRPLQQPEPLVKPARTQQLPLYTFIHP